MLSPPGTSPQTPVMCNKWVLTLQSAPVFLSIAAVIYYSLFMK